MPKAKYFLEKNLHKLRSPSKNGRPYKNLKGQKFDELTALEFMGMHPSSSYGAVWKCQCVCGNVCYTTAWELRSTNRKRRRCSKNHKKSLKNKDELELAKIKVHKKGLSLRVKTIPAQIDKMARMIEHSSIIPRDIILEQNSFIDDLKEASRTFVALGKSGTLNQIKESNTLLLHIACSRRFIGRFLKDKGIKL